MARSAQNVGTNPKFDADPPAMQRIMARAARGTRALRAAEKSRLRYSALRLAEHVGAYPVAIKIT